MKSLETYFLFFPFLLFSTDNVLCSVPNTNSNKR